MTQYEMTEKLSEKMHVTMEQAKAALEASDWNMLDAALLLEQEQAAVGKDETEKTCEAPKARCSGPKKIGRAIRDLIARGNRNHFVVRRNDATAIELPVTAMVILLLCAHWGCIVLLLIGLLAGCRYSFTGQDLGREDVNDALGKVADAADQVKEAVVEA